MNTDTIALLVLVAFAGIAVFLTRKRLRLYSFLRVFYFGMYRTRLGMPLMECLARKYEPLLKLSGWLMVPVGFLGMIVMVEELVRGVFKLLQSADALTVGLVLPIQAKGVFYVPFFYWLIAVLFVMVVHEFGHGIIARAHRVRVKSTGFAFAGALVPIIPGAFVEIDEKHLSKKSKHVQLSVFSAGPFVNIVFGLLFFALLVAVQPLAENVFVSEGMRVISVADNSPAQLSGLAVGDLITAIDGRAVAYVEDFENAFSGKKPGDWVRLSTKSGSGAVMLSGSKSALLGVQVQESRILNPALVEKHGWLLTSMLSWLVTLLYWLFVLNLGVGLFNLVPLGPIDGGRMFHTALQKIVPHRHARRIWHVTSTVLLVMIAGTLVAAFV